MKKYKNQKNNEQKSLSIQKIESEQRKWVCNACDGDSSTGCLSTTGECYR